MNYTYSYDRQNHRLTIKKAMTEDGIMAVTAVVLENVGPAVAEWIKQMLEELQVKE